MYFLLPFDDKGSQIFHVVLLPGGGGSIACVHLSDHGAEPHITAMDTQCEQLTFGEFEGYYYHSSTYPALSWLVQDISFPTAQIW